MAPPIEIRPLDVSRRQDFLDVMAKGSEEAAGCFCTAYHGQACAGKAGRDRLLDEGRSDGFLLYVDGHPAGWCQAGPWESFGLLASKPRDPGTWAVTCLVLARDFQGKGLAHALFQGVFTELRRRGARSAVAFGHRLGPAYSSPLAELPESLCLKAGMTLERDDAECPIYRIDL